MPNPVKSQKGLEAAKKAGVKRMTFDSKTEVDKTCKICTECRSFGAC